MMRYSKRGGAGLEIGAVAGERPVVVGVFVLGWRGVKPASNSNSEKKTIDISRASKAHKSNSR
jgi:hypothetical protein